MRTTVTRDWPFACQTIHSWLMRRRCLVLPLWRGWISWAG